MKKLIFLTASFLFVFTTTDFSQNQYVGSEICSSCHNTASHVGIYDLWKNSNHSQAYNTLVQHTLSKPSIIDGAKLWIVKMGVQKENYGLPTPANESEYCLPCHVTAFGIESKLIASSFNKEEGIQCESCHGPGAAHAELEKLKAQGKDISIKQLPRIIELVKYADMRKYKDNNSIKTECETCHNGMCGNFDFEKMFPTIKH